MFKRYYAKRCETANNDVPISTAAYTVRDNITHQIIAQGDYAQCVKYQSAFGLCYLAPAS